MIGRSRLAGWRTVYDADGRGQCSITADGQTTNYTYDAQGNQTKTTFADDTFITAVYDDLGRKTSETNQLGQTRTFEYYADGRLKAVILPAVNGQSPRYVYEYDAQGNQTLRGTTNTDE